MSSKQPVTAMLTVRGDRFYDFKIKIFVFMIEPNVLQLINKRHTPQAVLLSHQMVIGVSNIRLYKTTMYIIE